MTWVTVVLILSLVLGGYLARVWIPVWITHYEVQQVVRDYANQAVRIPDDAELVKNMLHKLRVLGDREVLGDDGRMTRVPFIEVDPKGVVWERDNQTSTLHVAFEYVCPIQYPLIGRSTEKVFQIDLTMDISRPDWGPAR